MKNILLIEDEASIRKFVKINLEKSGFNVLEAETGEAGIEIAKEENIDLVVLDLMLPGIDGLQVCKTLRGEFPNIGIIMLTAKSQDIDKIQGLENGTDDYMTKPFNPKELVLRVKSLSRRMENNEDKNTEEKNNQDIEFPPFKINSYSRKFYRGDEEIILTPTEYAIAKLFIENPGKAFKRDEILNMVWGYDFMGDSKIVDVNIRRLRSKIEDDPSEPIYIETVWGVGYRWKKEE